MLSGPSRLRNCLGFSRVESGHNRVPEPPDKMTGVIRVFCGMISLLRDRAGKEGFFVLGQIYIGSPGANSAFAGLDQFAADSDRPF